MNVCTKDCADPCGRCGKFGGKVKGTPKDTMIYPQHHELLFHIFSV